MNDKVKKLQALKDQISRGEIQSNIFEENSKEIDTHSHERQICNNEKIDFNLDQAESHQRVEEETYDKYLDGRKPVGDCKNDSNSDQSSKKAFDYAIRILSQRDYSVHKMKEKLKRRGCTKEQINQTIEKLLGYNYLRDEEYALMRAKQLLFKGYSNQYILQKLSVEQLSATEAQIEELRLKNDLSTDSQIDYLIEKKLRFKEVPKEFNAKMKLKQKVSNFLVSKGFSFDDINSHLSKFF